MRQRFAPDRAQAAGRRAAGSGVFLPFLLLLCGCGGPRLLRPTALERSMMHVPAGEFLMGRDDGDPDERPARRVWLDAFFIDRTEITNAQFKAFCDSTRRVYPNNPMWGPNYFLGKPRHPVVDIDWQQANDYCAWAGKRLPTEAEWEKAARGSDGRPYPWGNDWAEDRANIAGEPYSHTAPVGSFPLGASPYGALDMAGNAWEWCADSYAERYYAEALNRNPQGPAAPKPLRVVRGGGWSSPRTEVGTSNRSQNRPDLVFHHLGCRCAWSPR